MKLNLNLKQTKVRDKLTQIMIATTVNRRRIRVYTRLRVEPMYWNHINARCDTERHNMNRRELQRLKNINRQIDAIVNIILETDRRLASKGEFLTRTYIRNILRNRNNCCTTTTARPVETLIKMADDYSAHINRNGEKGRSATKVTYMTALRRLERFDRQRAAPISSFDQFDREFFDEFTGFLYNRTYGKERKRYTQNTVVNTLKVVKNMLHRAYDRELTANNCFAKIQTALPANVSEHVYLRETEIRKIAAAKTDSTREREVRDMFVIACYTALRISDIRQLQDAVIGNGRILLYQKKTKDRVEIPILKEIAQLVEHYKNIGFPTIDPSRANRIVRALAERCRINEPVCCKEQRGGTTTIVNKPKYELISFHTARRSCITNLYKRGYPANYVMILSGHKSIQAFQRYVKASSSELMENFLDLLRREKAIVG